MTTILLIIGIFSVALAFTIIIAFIVDVIIDKIKDMRDPKRYKYGRA